MGGHARDDGPAEAVQRTGAVGGTGLRVALALAWLCGIGVQLQQASLPAPWVHAAAAGGSGGVALAAWVGWLVLRRRTVSGAARSTGPMMRAVALTTAVLALAAFAWASTGWRAAQRLSDTLAPALIERTVLVDGVIASLPQIGEDATRFVFEVESARLVDGLKGNSDDRLHAVAVPPRLSVSWYRGGPAAGGDDWADLLAGPGTDLRAGQRWRLPMRLRPPWAPMNPHAPDLELRWFEQGIRALGRVRARADQPAQRLDAAVGAPPPVQMGVEPARQALRDRLLAATDDPRAAAVLVALAVGDQAGIHRDDWALFRDTGVAHLMSISGLHVTMFAWAAAGLAGWAWRRSPRLMLACPAPTVAPWFGLAAAAAYAVLAGWGVPAQRTVWMLASVVGLRALGLRWPAPLVLLAAAVVVTLIDPWALAQPGFWLSFVAVGVLMTTPQLRHEASAEPSALTVVDAGGRWQRAWSWLRREAAAMARTQGRVTLGLAPLSLLFFQQLSLAGLLANLLAVPLVTGLITPLALAGMAWPVLAQAAAGLLQGLMAVLAYLQHMPMANWTAAAPGLLAWLGGLWGVALLLLPLPRPWRVCGLVCLLPLVWPAVQRPGPGQFALLAADIGQGSAVLVRTQHHAVLVDAGPAYGRDSDAGQRVLLPLLRALGVERLDELLLTHSDTDHIGGAQAVLLNLPVARLRSSLPALHPLRPPLGSSAATSGAGGPSLPTVPHTDCAAGQAWTWDGVHFRVLHPWPDSLPAPPQARPNTLSCVLQVEDAQGRRALLTGDIERAQELALVDRYGSALRSDVLLVPHHGSRTSSSAPFLAAVAPTFAVVQAAYLSRFGHPAPDVVRRYGDYAAKLVRTDRCGAWVWFDGRTECTREVRRRYWHVSFTGETGAEVAKLTGSGDP